MRSNAIKKALVEEMRKDSQTMEMITTEELLNNLGAGKFKHHLAQIIVSTVVEGMTWTMIWTLDVGVANACAATTTTMKTILCRCGDMEGVIEMICSKADSWKG